MAIIAVITKGTPNGQSSFVNGLQKNKNMADSKTPLEVNRYYHLYNHAVGKELLFFKDENYLYFLNKLETKLCAYFNFYAYCLMPNHFHLVVSVKDYQTISSLLVNPLPEQELYLFLSRKLSNVFNSYAQAINKQEQRKGSLFYNRFKRKVINNEAYFVKLIHYLHYNPVKAGLCSNVAQWKYSSYKALISDKETVLNKGAVLQLFGGKANFIYCHKTEPSLSGIE